MQLRMRVYIPKGFRDRVFMSYNDPGLRDRVHMVYGLRSNNVIYAMALLLNNDSTGELVKPEDVIYGNNLLIDSGLMGLSLVGMVHYHGWPGGCNYLSGTDRGTLKSWPGGFIAFVASPNCLRAWYMHGDEVKEAELIEDDFIKYGVFSVGDRQYRVEPLNQVMVIPSTELSRVFQGVEGLIGTLTELTNELRKALGNSKSNSNVGLSLSNGGDVNEVIKELIRVAYMSEEFQWAVMGMASDILRKKEGSKIGIIGRLKAMLRK